MGETLDAEPHPHSHELISRDLCVLIFLNEKATGGRFAMSLDELQRATGLPLAEIETAIAWTAERDWLRRTSFDYVELKATGIHIAKESLDLPR